MSSITQLSQIKKHKLETAKRNLARANQEVQAAKLALEAGIQKAEDYHEWRIQEELKMLNEIHLKLLKRDELETLRGKIATIRGNESELKKKR